MELYLSRIQLNPYSKSVMKDLGNPRDLHKTISGCFPAIDGQEDKPQHERQTPRNVYKLLHRLDRKGDELVLYVQSTKEPDWGKLCEGYARDAATKPIHDLYQNICAGDSLRFRLQANPSKRVGKKDAFAADKFKDDKKRRRVDIRKTEDRIVWLNRKGEECGFRLLSVKNHEAMPNVQTGMQSALKFSHSKGSPSVTLGNAVFDGILEVTDGERFLNALVGGIGPGKAYGFGLMSVAPVGG